MSLDPAEGKSSPGGEGLCGWGRKGGGGGVNPSRDQNTPQRATLAGVVLHFGSLILCCIIWYKGSEEKHRHRRFRKLPNLLEALFVKNYGTASNGRHVRGRRRSEDWTGSAELHSRHGGDAGAAHFKSQKPPEVEREQRFGSVSIWTGKWKTYGSAAGGAIKYTVCRKSALLTFPLTGLIFVIWRSCINAWEKKKNPV